LGEVARPVLLNLGAGFNRLEGHINVDAWGDPDVKWNLNETPYPWADNSVDGIEMWHTLEHLPNWWEAFKECARILKPGGYLHIRVPDESSKTALTYRDHVAVFSPLSFHGIHGATHGTNAWAVHETGTVPLVLEQYWRVPFREYEWLARWLPRVMEFCADHLRNFIHEQRFHFRKVGA
jgi:ubiquinone/menaquinone biosynthesis C-methylase UbiE